MCFTKLFQTELVCNKQIQIQHFIEQIRIKIGLNPNCFLPYKQKVWINKDIVLNENEAQVTEARVEHYSLKTIPCAITTVVSHCTTAGAAVLPEMSKLA